MWCDGGFGYVYVVVDYVEDGLQGGGDDVVVIGVVGDQEGFVIFEYEGW